MFTVVFCIASSVVCYLNTCISFSSLITSVGVKRELAFRYRLLALSLFLFEGVPLPLGAWERLCYFIVALPGPSIQLFLLLKISI